MNLFVPPDAYRVGHFSGTLAEHLGYSREDVLVIINADDLGLTESVNKSIEELFTGGKVSSTTVMATGCAYPEAVRKVTAGTIGDCGLHLTLTSSLPDALARPILPQEQVPTVTDPHGNLYLDRDDFFRAATPTDAEKEATAQIEKALADGIDLTHLDSHEGTLQLRPEFAEVYLRLAERFRLPIRMGSRVVLRQIGYSDEWLHRARNAGLHFPDNFIYIPIDAFKSYEEKSAYILTVLDNLPPGVTELYFHPARVGSEPQQSNQTWTVRGWDYRILVAPETVSALARRSAKLISFRPLRDLVRA